MKNSFILYTLILNVSLIAMELNIPTVKDAADKGSRAQEYVHELKIKYMNHFNPELGLSYAIDNPKDWKTPIIIRFAETVIERALVLRDPHLQRKFNALHKKKDTKSWLYHNVLRVDVESKEASRSVLADRQLITYILRGTKDQPWIVRPEFDQEWSAIRREIKEEERADRNAMFEKRQRIVIEKMQLIERENVNSSLNHDVQREQEQETNHFPWLGPATAAALIRTGALRALWP